MKTCGSFRDLKLTNDIKTTTTLYTIQTEVIHERILVSSPITRTALHLWNFTTDIVCGNKVMDLSSVSRMVLARILLDF